MSRQLNILPIGGDVLFLHTKEHPRWVVSRLDFYNPMFGRAAIEVTCDPTGIAKQGQHTYLDGRTRVSFISRRVRR